MSPVIPCGQPLGSAFMVHCGDPLTFTLPPSSGQYSHLYTTSLKCKGQITVNFTEHCHMNFAFIWCHPHAKLKMQFYFILSFCRGHHYGNCFPVLPSLQKNDIKTFLWPILLMLCAYSYIPQKLNL